MNDYIIKLIDDNGVEYCSFPASGYGPMSALEIAVSQGYFFPYSEPMTVIAKSFQTGFIFKFQVARG